MAAPSGDDPAPSATQAPAEEAPGLDRALGWIRLLAEEIGPRRPTGPAERQAAERMRDELRALGVEAELEPFEGHSSFAWPLGAIALAGVLPALLPRRAAALRTALAAASVAGLVTEGGLVRTRHTPSAWMSRRPSQNVVATIEARVQAQRTLCLVCHLDTSRGGWLFHPAVSRHVNTFFTAGSAACLVQGAEPLLSRFGLGRAVLGTARATLAAGLALLAEREIRGEDAPGANDNASGAAVAAVLAAEIARSPLATTRLVLLMTGCEESGLLGAQAFLRNHDTRGWLFVNFDSVGGPATLRYARREGIGGIFVDADPTLLDLAARVARDRPELRLEPADRPIGLTYDTTPVLASGGRAITFIAGDETIPNYHWPTDTPENIDPDVVARAIATGREMIAAIDRGQAD